MKTLELIDMQDTYSVGDLVELLQPCNTKLNKYKKGEMFLVERVTKTTLYLRNDKGGLTIHRFISNMIEKAPG